MSIIKTEKEIRDKVKELQDTIKRLEEDLSSDFDKFFDSHTEDLYKAKRSLHLLSVFLPDYAPVAFRTKKGRNMLLKVMKKGYLEADKTSRKYLKETGATGLRLLSNEWHISCEKVSFEFLTGEKL